jgi:general stress protein 26
MKLVTCNMSFQYSNASRALYSELGQLRLHIKQPNNKLNRFHFDLLASCTVAAFLSALVHACSLCSFRLRAALHTVMRYMYCLHFAAQLTMISTTATNTAQKLHIKHNALADTSCVVYLYHELQHVTFITAASFSSESFVTQNSVPESKRTITPNWEVDTQGHLNCLLNT